MSDLRSLRAQQIQHACRFSQPDWEPGSTEPWVIDVVAALMVANGSRVVVELGGYKGACSRPLAALLDRMGGGQIHVVEYDPVHVATLKERFDALPLDCTTVTVYPVDSLTAMAHLPTEIDFAWVDDSHDTPHVVAELQHLIPRMRDGGIICFHDVVGHYNLQYVVNAYGGYCLDLPRVSSSGELGILQVTPETRQRRVWVDFDGSALEAGEQTVVKLSLYGQEQAGDLHLSPAG